MSPPDPHTLVGPYVLDALPADERDLFEDHLSRCPECQTEAAELLAAAAHLGQAAAVVPPAALRDQVLAQVAQTRQVAPGGSFGAGERRRRPWVTPVLAAAAVVVLAAVGAIAVRSDQRADQAEDLVAIVADPEAETVEVSGEGGTMRLVVSDAHDSSVVVAEGMAAPPPGKTYALWFDEAGVMVLHGTFAPDDDGSVRVRVDGVPSDVVGVTVEDAGETPREPTFPTVATGSL
ncbi:anti-sigma factor [Iamia sp. SCSIO 61187]|uniref:anti-sigma factor n=1 Tax=Iamia sp. SCSIO 61187 TaxID=2722752 RepID=UPI001C639790|nr:anti-sigma factor [Iamia sp. SCSIO 61187]QYG95597.1 anti-sigma factor [Iamia sp. SCSIO 61187]